MRTANRVSDPMWQRPRSLVALGPPAAAAALTSWRRHLSCARRPIDIEDLQMGRTQPLTHSADKPLHQLVAEIMIGFAFVTKTARIDPERAHELRSARIEGPAIGRHKPCSIQNVAFAQG